jgi:hypothetical protein
MATLKDIVSATYFRLGDLHSGTVESGSQTTVVDSSLGGKQDDWKDAVVMIDYDAGGAGAAPEGEYKLCSGYAAATGTLTTASFSVAPAASDLYSVATPRIPLAVLVSVINQRLTAMGDVPAVDTSLSFVSAQSLYTLPAAARGNRLKQVWEATNSDTDDPDLTPREDWYMYGTTQISFRGSFTPGDVIHLFYVGTHARMGAFGDVLSPFIHIDRISSDAAYWATRAFIAKSRGSSKEVKDQLQMLFNDAELAKKEHKIWLPMGTKQAVMVPDDTRLNRYGPWLNPA